MHHCSANFSFARVAASTRRMSTEGMAAEDLASGECGLKPRGVEAGEWRVVLRQAKSGEVVLYNPHAQTLAVQEVSPRW